MIEHSTAVFEARSEDEYLHALNATFSPDLIFFANGVRGGIAQFKEMSQTVVTGSDFQCKAEWKASVAVPTDPSNPNRVCALTGKKSVVRLTAVTYRAGWLAGTTSFPTSASRGRLKCWSGISSLTRCK